MEEYISGEKHREMITERPPQPSFPKPLLFGIAAVVLLGLAFYSGVAYQKGRSPNSSPVTAGSLNGQGQAGIGGGGRFGGMRRNIGQVTAVSDTSISVNSLRSGTDATFSISADTKITNNGQTVAAANIKVGDTVLIVPASDKTQAASILVNPSFGGSIPGLSPGTSAPNTNTPTITN